LKAASVGFQLKAARSVGLQNNCRGIPTLQVRKQKI